MEEEGGRDDLRVHVPRQVASQGSSLFLLPMNFRRQFLPASFFHTSHNQPVAIIPPRANEGALTNVGTINYNALVLVNRRNNDESRTDRPSSCREEYSLGDRRQRRNGEGRRGRADGAEMERGTRGPDGGAAAVVVEVEPRMPARLVCDESRMNERESMRPSRGGRGPPSPRTTLVGKEEKRVGGGWSE